MARLSWTFGIEPLTPRFWQSVFAGDTVAVSVEPHAVGRIVLWDVGAPRDATLVAGAFMDRGSKVTIDQRPKQPAAFAGSGGAAVGPVRSAARSVGRM